MNAEVNAIIAEVFRLSGIKLSENDPILPVLLLQEGRLKALFAEQRVHNRQDFDEIIAEIEVPLKAAVKIAEDLQTYREQIMADLMNGYGKQLAEAEAQMYASIQAKVVKQAQEQIDYLVYRLNRSQWVVAVSLLVVFVVAFVLLKLL